MRRIGEIAAKGLDHSPDHVRFVTWTLKYSRCHWLQVLGLDEHYARAELDARVDGDGTVEVAEPRNVTRFAILPPVADGRETRVRVGGAAVPVPERRGGPERAGIVLGKRDGRWVYLGELDDLELQDGKRPGLQGPIDDAFTTPFLCVRGTGTAWNPAVQAWAEASLKRFAYEWNRYFRGELPVKDDTAVTAGGRSAAATSSSSATPAATRGSPGCSRSCRSAGRARNARSATRRSPRPTTPRCLIQPNPLAAGRYVVLNSGHTFHEKELVHAQLPALPPPGRLGRRQGPRRPVPAAGWRGGPRRLLR